LDKRKKDYGKLMSQDSPWKIDSSLLNSIKKTLYKDVTSTNKMKHFDQYKKQFENLTQTKIYDTDKGTVINILINETA
jgi:hypothetical protein